jgi:hypothetical protein
MAKKRQTDDVTINKLVDSTGQLFPAPPIEPVATPATVEPMAGAPALPESSVMVSTIPPADDDDFFSPENLRLAQDFAPAEKSSTLAIELKKPPADTFIKIHPDPNYSLVWPTVEKDETMYVVHPRLAKQLETDSRMATLIKPVRFVLCAIHQGPFFMWPVKQSVDPANQSTVHKALDQAVAFGMAGWVRITWNPKLRIHETFEYRGPSVAEPVWPDKPFSELMKIALGEARMIKDINHSTLRKLAGLEL